MDLCFFPGTGLVSSAIRWWTSSPYSHVEFRFSDGRHWGAHPEQKATGWRTQKEPCHAVRLEVNEFQEARLLNFCVDETGCPYDWKGIFLAQMVNRARSHPDAWFCSEVCVAGLQVIGLLPSFIMPCTVSPGELFRVWTALREEPGASKLVG